MNFSTCCPILDRLYYHLPAVQYTWGVGGGFGNPLDRLGRSPGACGLPRPTPPTPSCHPPDHRLPQPCGNKTNVSCPPRRVFVGSLPSYILAISVLSTSISSRHRDLLGRHPDLFAMALVATMEGRRNSRARLIAEMPPPHSVQMLAVRRTPTRQQKPPFVTRRPSSEGSVRQNERSVRRHTLSEGTDFPKHRNPDTLQSCNHESMTSRKHVAPRTRAT